MKKSFSKKGLTLIELLVVVAIILIMTSVLLVLLSGGREEKAVEVAARQVAAAIREAQNNALGGKEVATSGVSCGWGVAANPSGSDKTEYRVFYNTPDSDCPNASKSYDASSNSVDSATYSLENKVEFVSNPRVYFTKPHGNVFNASGEVNVAVGGKLQFLVQSKIDSSVQYSVCVYSSGRVEEKRGGGC